MSSSPGDQYWLTYAGSNEPASGPHTLASLSEQQRSGRVRPGAVVCKVGESAWKPLADVLASENEEEVATTFFQAAGPGMMPPGRPQQPAARPTPSPQVSPLAATMLAPPTSPFAGQQGSPPPAAGQPAQGHAPPQQGGYAPQQGGYAQQQQGGYAPQQPGGYPPPGQPGGYAPPGQPGGYPPPGQPGGYPPPGQPGGYGQGQGGPPQGAPPGFSQPLPGGYTGGQGGGPGLPQGMGPGPAGAQAAPARKGFPIWAIALIALVVLAVPVTLAVVAYVFAKNRAAPPLASSASAASVEAPPPPPPAPAEPPSSPPGGTADCSRKQPGGCAGRCAQGDKRACDWQGLSLFESKDAASKAQALELFKKACEGGLGRACTHLGQKMRLPTGPRLKPASAAERAEAAQSIAKGCELEDGVGCSFAAADATAGVGVPRDPAKGKELSAKAIPMLEKQCEASDEEACFSLAVSLETGRGVARDTKRAKTLYTKACEQGEPGACTRLKLPIK